MKDHDDYRPTSARRKLLILLLAVATAVTLILTLLKRPAGAMDAVHISPKAGIPDAARCDEGNSHQCVGGKADVIVVPPPANSPKP